MSHAAQSGPGPSRRARARRRGEVLFRRVLRIRLVRAGMRYHFGRGGLLSGGVTYSALLSVTAALTIFVNVLRAFLGNRPDLMAAALGAIDEVLPGLIDQGTGPGVLDPESLIVDNPWTPTTLISSVIVLWTALTMMTGLRRSIRAMFGLSGAPVPLVLGKTRDLVGFVGLGLGILLASALGTAASFAGEAVFTALGVEGEQSAFWLRLGALAVAAVVDGLVFVMLFRITAGVRPPRRDLLFGAVFGAIGAGVLRFGGTALLGAIQDPLLASFAAIVTLLLWINLAIRFALFTAAWTANPPTPLIPVQPKDVHAGETPNYVTESAPHTLSWPHHEVTGSLLIDPGDELMSRGDGTVEASPACERPARRRADRTRT